MMTADCKVMTVDYKMMSVDYMMMWADCMTVTVDFVLSNLAVVPTVGWCLVEIHRDITDFVPDSNHLVQVVVLSLDKAVILVENESQTHLDIVDRVGRSYLDIMLASNLWTKLHQTVVNLEQNFHLVENLADVGIRWADVRADNLDVERMDLVVDNLVVNNRDQMMMVADHWEDQAIHVEHKFVGQEWAIALAPDCLAVIVAVCIQILAVTVETTDEML